VGVEGIIADEETLSDQECSIKLQDGPGAWAGALGMIFLLFLYLTVTLIGFIQIF
jgi:hypothetical protein